MPVAAILGAAVSLGESLLGSHKTDAQKASDFVTANYAEIAAGNNAPGKGLNALQYRTRPAYAWMLQPDTRGILLQEVQQVVHAGLAKASDFDRSIAEAAGLLPGPSNVIPGQQVAPGGGGSPSTSTALPSVGGLSLWWVLGLAGAAGLAFWYFKRRR